MEKLKRWTVANAGKYILYTVLVRAYIGMTLWKSGTENWKSSVS
jgi:hypothetical protein